MLIMRYKDTQILPNRKIWRILFLSFVLIWKEWGW